MDNRIVNSFRVWVQYFFKHIKFSSFIVVTFVLLSIIEALPGGIRSLALSSTGSILSNTDLSDLSTVGTCDIFVAVGRGRPLI